MILLNFFNMLIHMLILVGLAFSSLYPLVFWLRPHAWRGDSYKFHLALPNTVGGLAVIALMFMPVPWSIKGTVLGWKAVLVGVSHHFWKKRNPDPRWMTVPCVIGMCVLVRVYIAIRGFGG